MKLWDFASDIAEGLIDLIAKIGRPLVSSPSVKPPTNRPIKRPADVIRKDGTNHLPMWDEKRCANSVVAMGFRTSNAVDAICIFVKQRQKLLCGIHF